MKKFLSILASFIISGAYTINIMPGWQLKGALEDINVSLTFNDPNIISVWTYENGKWRAYFPNMNVDLNDYGLEKLDFIKKGEGFWINSLGDTTIDTIQVQSSFKLPLIDTPVNFTLDDIAGKTFKIFNWKDGEFVDLAFNENGEGSVSFGTDTYNLKFVNGILKVYYKDKFKGYFKKLKANDNGIISVGLFYSTDGNNTVENQFLDAWLVNINPVDMSTLNYPLTFYNQWGEEVIYEDNGTVLYPGEFEENYTIENGKIVINDEYNDNNYSGWLEKDYGQIISQIDRYYVMKWKGIFSDWYIDSALKAKTFDDIKDTDISIYDWYLKSDGTINEYDTSITATYQEINSTFIIVKECYEDDCYEYNVTLNSDSGKVIRTEVYYYSEIISNSPIIKNPNSKLLKVNFKDYIMNKLKRIKKRRLQGF